MTTAKIDATLKHNWVAVELRKTDFGWTWFITETGASTHVSAASEWGAIELARKAWQKAAIDFDGLPTVSIERARAIKAENDQWDWQNEDRPNQSFGIMEQDTAMQVLRDAGEYFA